MDLLNQVFNSGNIINKHKGDVVEACQRVEAIEIAAKCSREVLSKMEAKIAKVKATGP